MPHSATARKASSNCMMPILAETSFSSVGPETSRKAYDLSLRARDFAATLSPSQPLPSAAQLSSNCIGPPASVVQGRFAPNIDAPESPFPGYRVPPGGYPGRGEGQHPLRTPDLESQSDSVLPEYSSRQALLREESAAFDDVAPRSPFELFQHTLNEMHELALRDKRYPDLSLPPHGHHGSHGKGGPGETKCKTARKEWTEAKTETNGDRVVRFSRPCHSPCTL